MCPNCAQLNLSYSVYCDGERKQPPPADALRRDFSEALIEEWGENAEFRAKVVSARMEKIYAGLSAVRAVVD